MSVSVPVDAVADAVAIVGAPTVVVVVVVARDIVNGDGVAVAVALHITCIVVSGVVAVMIEALGLGKTC